MSTSQPLAAAPALETERLHLRALTAEDFPAFCALWNDPAVYQYITGHPLSEEDHWARMLRLAGLWVMAGIGSWAVIEKPSGDMVGQCGFGLHRRTMEFPMPEPELGWVLLGRHHGKGLGYEATRAAAQWGDRNIDASTTACIIDPQNSASVALGKKLGFVPVAETTYKTKPILVLHRKRFTPLP